MINCQTDTIVAPATGLAPAGVAVVRLSGPEAIAIGARLGGLAARRLRHGRMRLRRLRTRADIPLDRGYVVAFRAPRSFTGEDVCELHVHGSPAVIAAVVEATCELGARPATAGEFSRRAFLAGKLDLAAAEALQELISARSEAARQLALDHLDGRVGALLAELREPMVTARAELEARLDFAAHEDVGPLPAGLAAGLLETAAELRTLATTARAGRARIDGLRVALYGAPNAGKSTLFNALVGADRALVHPLPGTTRDVVEARTEAAGVTLTWLDTAGIRTATGALEAAGIERARSAVATADIVLWLQDGSIAARALPPPPEGPPARLVLRYLSKADLPAYPARDAGDGFAGTPISARRPADLERVRRDLREAAAGLTGQGVAARTVLTRQRHATALRRAADALERAAGELARDGALELAAADLRDAADALAEVTGEIAPDDVLDAIFSRLCVGK